MKYVVYLFLLLFPLAAISEDTAVSSLFGNWYSGRPRWADHLNIRPDGTANGYFPVAMWGRSMPIEGTWTKIDDDSVAFKWGKPFGPIAAKLIIEGGKPQLLSIEKHEDMTMTLPMHRESDLPAVDQSGADRPYMSRIYPVGHFVQDAARTRVTVIGMVKHPGVYYLDSSWHLVSFIDLCGLMRYSYTQRIKLLRDIDGKDKRLEINLKKLMEQGQIFELKDGDVYYVDYLPL